MYDIRHLHHMVEQHTMREEFHNGHLSIHYGMYIDMLIDLFHDIHRRLDMGLGHKSIHYS